MAASDYSLAHWCESIERDGYAILPAVLDAEQVSRLIDSDLHPLGKLRAAECCTGKERSTGFATS